MTTVIQQLHNTLLLQDAPDKELLEGYLGRRDEAALETLVRRHGPMVWNVCRRALRNQQDAEDAFQATFLVFVRKAASILPREMVGNWLYGVAHQTALKANTMAARRRLREKQVPQMPEAATSDKESWTDLQALLDRELDRLPDKHRVVIVLCDLEGKTRGQAARQLGWPEGTVAGRLARARATLAKRLTQRGIALSAGALPAVLSQQAAPACVPAFVLSSTIKTATLMGAGQPLAAGALSTRVAALTEGVLKAMLLTRLKRAMTLVLALVLAVGMVGMAYGALGGEEPATMHATVNGQGAVPPPDPSKQLPKKEEDTKNRLLEGIVKEIDDSSILLTNGQRMLLNEKTKYLRETGDDAARIKHADITRGLLIYAQVKNQGEIPLALVVVIRWPQLGSQSGVQPPNKLKEQAPGSAEAAPVLRATFAGHLDEVRTVLFLDDRTVVACSGKRTNYSLEPVGEGEVKFWDVSTAKTSAVLHAKGAPFTDLAISPNGKLLVTGRQDRTAALWDRNEQKLLATLGTPRDTGRILAVRFSPDGKTIATAGESVQLWDVASRKSIATFPVAWAAALAFSPDGKTLAIRADAGVQCWDVASGKQTAFFAVGASVLALAFSPDGKLLATGDGNHYVLLWDVATQKLVFNRFIRRFDMATARAFDDIRGHNAPVRSLAFRPDGKLLASACDMGTIKLWKVATGEELALLKEHQGAVCSVAFSANGTVLASGGGDRTVKLWDLPPAWHEKGQAQGGKPSRDPTKDFIKVEMRGQLQLVSRPEDKQLLGVIAVGTGSPQKKYELELPADKNLEELARKLDGQTVLLAGELVTIVNLVQMNSGPNLPRDVIRVRTLKRVEADK